MGSLHSYLHMDLKNCISRIRLAASLASEDEPLPAVFRGAAIGKRRDVALLI